MSGQTKNFGVLILAAGMGTRMKSSLPKVLHTVCGKPILRRILEAASSQKPDAIAVIVGHQADLTRQTVTDGLPSWAVNAPVEILQQKQLSGSGRAAQEASDFIAKHKNILILCGDTPLITGETLAGFHETFTASGAAAAVLTADVPDPKGYGRIVRSKDGLLDKIVEETETDAATAAVREINSGMYVFSSEALLAALPLLRKSGPKQEFYLTDTIAILRQQGLKVIPFKSADCRELLGVNSRAQLAQAEAILRRRKNDELMAAGVTFIDPERTYIDSDVTIGPDTTIYPNTTISGKTVIGGGCVIEPNCWIADMTIGDNCHIKAGSYMLQSAVSANCAIGPYAHLRPGTKLAEKAKVGNFTEIKASEIGTGSKVPHLTYVGDAVIGSGVNVGAGTITCNYDGKKKNGTVIGDGAFSFRRNYGYGGESEYRRRNDNL